MVFQKGNTLGRLGKHDHRGDKNPMFGKKRINPSGKNSSSYKTGKGIYRKLTLKLKECRCERCNSTDYILVHHKDRNRENNEIENLEVICKSCHAKEHELSNNINKKLGHSSSAVPFT